MTTTLLYPTLFLNFCTQHQIKRSGQPISFCLVLLCSPWNSDLMFLFFFPLLLLAVNFGTHSVLLCHFRTTGNLEFSVHNRTTELEGLLERGMFLGHLRAYCVSTLSLRQFHKKVKGMNLLEPYLSKALKRIKHLKHWDQMCLSALLYSSQNDYYSN